MVYLIILAEAILFLIAALVHYGKLISDYEHSKARVAESVIAVVLFAGLALGVIHPIWAHTAGLVVQSFTLLGTCVGIITIIIGVGPRTKPDILFHAIILILLAYGLTLTGLM